MQPLTENQRRVFDFVRERLDAGMPCPTIREIAANFGWKSAKAASDHIDALKRKGWLASDPKKARSLRLTETEPARDPLVNGAAFTKPVNLRISKQAFALEVRGNSMIGRHIVAGDVVFLDPELPPRSGDIVAAVIGNESTLMTYVTGRGEPLLREESPHSPRVVPASEVKIQGVMVALVRRRK